MYWALFVLVKCYGLMDYFLFYERTYFFTSQNCVLFVFRLIEVLVSRGLEKGCNIIKISLVPELYQVCHELTGKKNSSVSTVVNSKLHLSDSNPPPLTMDLA